MVKNIIIAVLAAMLIQPHWTNVTSLFDAVICFSITFGSVFVVITDLEECLKEKGPKRRNSKGTNKK